MYEMIGGLYGVHGLACEFMCFLQHVFYLVNFNNGLV